MKSAALLLLASALFAADPAGIHIPFEKYKLGNGLPVVLARDSTVPVVAVYIRCGVTEFSEALPSNQLGQALSREADRMRAPNVNRKPTDNQPYGDALYRQWPAFIAAGSDPGDAGGACAPNSAVLVISGDFNPPEAKKLAADSFAGIPAQPQPKHTDLKAPARTEGRTETVKDPNARLPAVIVGWPAPPRHSQDWYAIYMIDAVLTAGDTARLKLNMMKARLSLLQGESNLGFPAATPLDFKDPGYYAAILMYRPNFEVREILDQYQSEIDRIAQDGIGPSELERFRSVLRFEKVNSVQTALGRARLLGIHELMDGDAGFYEKDYANLLAVTSEQMQAAASKYLTANRRDVMAIQPAGAK